jgi:hypothetical protein
MVENLAVPENLAMPWEGVSLMVENLAKSQKT